MRTDLLIAEADAELRSAYGRLFSEVGLRVETAADGLECWTKLRGCSPGALVVDMEILWGGGDGVLARLREDRNGAVTPIVFVTGDDPPMVLSRRVGIAVGSCFQKPFRMSRLLDSVCTELDTGAETISFEDISPSSTADHSECRSDSQVTMDCVGVALLLTAEIERALHATGYQPLRRVAIAIDSEVVFLRGRVPTYHMKQLAQAAVLAVPGVCEVRNELDIVESR